MDRRFGAKHEEFVYFNTNYHANRPRRLTSKTVSVNAKSVVNESPKKEKEIATPQDVINDFLDSTSVHGLQYFGKIDIKVGIMGKILWICTMLTGFVCLSLMVMQFLNRYRENPTITYVKSFTSPIFEIPFPAVTICPLTPMTLERQTRIVDTVILPENVSKEMAMEFFRHGRRITLPYKVETYPYADKLQSFLDANKWSVLDFLKVLHPCDEIFESCWWNEERIACDKFIKHSGSSYGLCCSYNYVLEQYVGRAKTQPKIMPQTSVTIGPWSGLKLEIRKDIFGADLDVNSETDNLVDDGVGLLIHHSMEYPGLNSNLYVLQPGHELHLEENIDIKIMQWPPQSPEKLWDNLDRKVAILPFMIKKPVGMYQRDAKDKLTPLCISDDENNLEYFPIYRYSNCYTNCRIKAMLKICGCVPYIYHFLTYHHPINQCNTTGLTCIQENATPLAIVKDTENQDIVCSCQPPCDNVHYDSFPNNIAQINPHDYSSNSSKGTKNMVLKVFMTTQNYQILETLPAADEIYLLASIGGIFSLFLGCSFLSLVEIIYFAGLLCRALFLSRKIKKERPTRETFMKRRAY